VVERGREGGREKRIESEEGEERGIFEYEWREEKNSVRGRKRGEGRREGRRGAFVFYTPTCERGGACVGAVWAPDATEEVARALTPWAESGSHGGDHCGWLSARGYKTRPKEWREGWREGGREGGREGDVHIGQANRDKKQKTRLKREERRKGTRGGVKRVLLLLLSLKNEA
jgi:hypothetical protein